MKILVTGTSSGLGQQVVKVFRDFGHKTVGLSRSGSEETDYVCDFSDPEELERALETLCKEHHAFDCIFLNAGILGKICKATEISQEELQNVFQINLFSNKQIIDHLVISQVKIGTVLAISSGASLKAYDGWLSYCLTKASLNQMIRCYAVENENIKFLSIAPGVIQTKMQDQIVKNCSKTFSSIDKFKSLYGNIPTPKEVAEKMYVNLGFLKSLKSGDYYDLREIND